MIRLRLSYVIYQIDMVCTVALFVGASFLAWTAPRRTIATILRLWWLLEGSPMAVTAYKSKSAVTPFPFMLFARRRGKQAFA